MAPNLKQRLMDGACAVGAGIWTNSPDMVEWAAVGMHWAWWECQHTFGDWENTIHGVRAAHTVGLPILVRTWTHDAGVIEKLLDTGADGIIVPMVNTARQAEAVVAHCYFPPAGDRSYGAVRPTRIEPDLDSMNGRIVVVLMLETPQAIENAEEIAKVPGVDALMVGAVDLSLRKGKSCDLQAMHGNTSDEMKRVLDVCLRTKKAAMTIVLSPDDLKARITEGYRLVVAGFDVDVVEESNRLMMKAFREISQGAG